VQNDKKEDSRLLKDKQISEHLKELKQFENSVDHRKPHDTDQSGVIFRLNSDYTAIEYNVAEIEKFLEVVFHTELIDDEEILCYRDYGQHNRAISEDTLLQVLERSKKPARLYVATATVKLDRDGTLRNKLTNFCRYHMLVLDDIGTKVPIDKITLEPTYIIESSPGNFQFGYVLKEPLERLEEAQALVDLVYSSGLSDEGGKLATKKVRLPGGVNGKRNKNFGFQSRLHKLETTYFTPQQIIDGLGITADWKVVVNDTVEARRRLKIAGSSHWSSVPLALPSNAGIVDTVAEWLFTQNYVKNISGDWLEIQCPWHEEHSDPHQSSAYYSPIGLGEKEHQQSRAFYCHHSHPETTADFLCWVSAEGGPEAPVHDPSAELVASCVFDSVNNIVWDIKSSIAPISYDSVTAFQQENCKKLLLKSYSHTSGKAKFRSIPAHELWSQHPARVVVKGTTFNPSTPARIVLDDKVLKLNLYCMPDYGIGAYDAAIVTKFLDFLAYLIPDAKEWNTFVDWLAAKMQNLAFRGWGMLMIAPQQRTGRGTLISMLSSLFYEPNCTQISMTRLLDPSDTYNEWETKTMVFVGESEAQSFHGNKFYAAYNRLKDVVDTTVRQTIVNHKYGRMETRNVYTSFLICANETMGIAMGKDDERMYVIQNSTTRESPEYFQELNEWRHIEDEYGRPAWCKHVARYLKNRKIDVAFMNGPAPMTDTKRDLLVMARSPLDIALDTMLESLPGSFIPNGLAEKILIKGGFGVRLEIESRVIMQVVRKALCSRTMAIPKTLRINGETVRYRARLTDAQIPMVQALKMGYDERGHRETARDMLERINEKALIKRIDEALAIEGF